MKTFYLAITVTPPINVSTIQIVKMYQAFLKVKNLLKIIKSKNLKYDNNFLMCWFRFRNLISNLLIKKYIDKKKFTHFDIQKCSTYLESFKI